MTTELQQKKALFKAKTDEDIRKKAADYNFFVKKQNLLSQRAKELWDMKFKFLNEEHKLHLVRIQEIQKLRK